MRLAIQLSSTITGRRTRTTIVSGGASASTARSGPASAMFFGTISPSTTCRNPITASAIVKAAGCTSASGRPMASNGASSAWAIAGSPR